MLPETLRCVGKPLQGRDCRDSLRAMKLIPHVDAIDHTGSAGANHVQ